MADTNVKIKLTADGKQVRQELKLIDKEFQELGGTSNTPKSGGTQGSKASQKSDEKTQVTRDSKDVAKQESRDKVNEKLTRELTLIRKELQKMNGTSGQGGGASSTTSTTSNGGGNNSTPPTNPTGNGNGDGSGSGSGGSSLSSVLSKLATAAVAMKAASAAWNYLSSGAASSRSGESQAYSTYGSTLAYTDYYTAKKDSYELGLPYGYDYSTVMSAGDTNMSKAGFTTLENYTNDMDSILKASKGWGIDTSTLSSTSGYMTQIGVTESGDQSKFVNMLSQSIVDAQMTGREDEQLQVLEDIAENLAQVNTSVSEDSMTSQLNMYNALVAQNEDLKGTRGSTLVNSMQDLATSGDTSLDILAGLNTTYTGKEGYIELRKLAEEDPTQYWKQVIQGARSYGYKDSDIEYKLLQSSGLSTSEIEDLMSAVDNVENYSMDDTSEGEEELQKRIDNYNGSDVSTEEQSDINKDYSQEAAGDTLVNSWLNPLKSLYNKLPTGVQSALGIVGSVTPTVAGAVGLSKAGSAIKNAGGLSGIWSKFTGKGTTTGTSEAASAASEAAEGVASATDDVVKAATDSMDEVADVIEDAAKSAGKSVDEAVGAASSATSGLDDGLKAAGETASEVAKSAGSGVDDGLRTAGDVAEGLEDGLSSASKATSGLDDAASAASKGLKGLSKAGKVLGIIGTGIEVATTTYDAYKDVERGDNRAASQEVGGGIGSIAGGAGGAAAGAAVGAAVGSVVPIVGTAIGGVVGGVIGGVAGGIGGNAIGEKAGEGVYDLATGGDEYDFTAEEKKQIQEYYDEVQRLYEEEGNNAAQKYTKKYVTPYLNQIGVSTSVTDAYKWDVGTPDFLKDVDNGTFGDLSYDEEELGTIDDAKEAIEDLTEKIEELIGKTDEDTSTAGDSSSSGTDSSVDNPMSNTKTTGSLWSKISNWFTGGTSHATGNDYVPYDDYTANLHKGEMVLTKMEADDYRQGKDTGLTGAGGTSQSNVNLNINVTGAIDGMTAENQAQIVNAIKQQIANSNLQNMISNGFQRVQNY